MFETLLIPAAIPHRCSLGSFIGTSFQPPPSPSSSSSSSFSNTSFIMSLSHKHMHACTQTPPAFILSLVSGFQKLLLINSAAPPPPLPVCSNLLQAKLSPPPPGVHKAMLLIGHRCRGSRWQSTSVPRMTPAHCGHLEAQLDEHSSDRGACTWPQRCGALSNQ